ncbi:hypothetical protein H2248_007013 [Termitomyces sp. 'cryptogamus']|nr:hypothetical protein H2248_007013 [Termitomyces sp. 'cryptogamus']
METTFDMSFDPSLDSYPSNILSAELYTDPTMAGCSLIQPTIMNDFWLEGSELFPNLGDSDFPHQSHGFDEPVFTADFGTLISAENTTDTSPRTSADQSSSMENLFNDPPTQSFSSQDLELYLNLFFRVFCAQVPLVHTPTWTMEDKPLILVRAMQACGALFVRTSQATAFIDEILSTRNTLVAEFAKLPTDAREQNHLLLTLVLLQTTALFHQQSDQRISSDVYHGMLVMIVRCTGVLPRVNAWVPPDMDDVSSLDTLWREWANYEMIKRVLFLSYLHDCCHCMYFAITPSFQPSELDICLPCDDALWCAPDAVQWSSVLQTSSPYGVGNQRIMGFPMQTALAVLNDTRFSKVTLVFTPFAHFILIHTILRNIYASHAFSSSIDVSLLGTDTRSVTTESSIAVGENPDESFAIQYALHNWFRTWSGSLESTVVERTKELSLIRNALSFYWLAQISLLAIQNKSADSGGQLSDVRTEGRFRLMKKWLDHIRAFLRSGHGTSPHLWEELSKLRTQMSIQDRHSGDENTNWLLSFFFGSGI